MTFFAACRLSCGMDAKTHPLDRDEVLNRLRRHQPALRALGVRHLSLFGSLARREAGADSDVDVLLDIDPAAPVSLLGIVRIQNDLSRLLDRPVDVAEAAAMKLEMRERVLREAVGAF